MCIRFADKIISSQFRQVCGISVQDPSPTKKSVQVKQVFSAQCLLYDGASKSSPSIGGGELVVSSSKSSHHVTMKTSAGDYLLNEDVTAKQLSRNGSDRTSWLLANPENTSHYIIRFKSFDASQNFYSCFEPADSPKSPKAPTSPKKTTQNKTSPVQPPKKETENKKKDAAVPVTKQTVIPRTPKATAGKNQAVESKTQSTTAKPKTPQSSDSSTTAKQVEGNKKQTPKTQ